MKPLTLLIIIAAILGVGIWFAQPGTTEPKTATLGTDSESSPFSAPELAYDFGTIRMANGKVSHEFKFRNAGADPVRLTRLYTSCMCTEATLVMIGREYGPYGMPGHGFLSGFSESLKPGGEATLTVTFDPNAHGPAGVGPIERVAYLENDAGEPLEFVITGQVTP